MNKLLCLFICLVFAFSTAMSQKERNTWYFGQNAGIDFNQGSPPTALTNGAMQTSEGCATISDSLGQLLFYTDGLTVWNANHAVMTNGTGLLGHPSSTQSSIIVPNPADYNKYYIFTMVEPSSLVPFTDGMNYSEVDMSLSGGLGAITAVKNVRLLPGTEMTEKLAAVRHANGTDFWVVAHELNSDAFHAFHVDASGVNPAPVTSHTGSFHNGAGPISTWQYQGYLRFSPDGRRLVNGLSNFLPNFTEIFDFDNATGIISNPMNITPNGTGAYCVEFSPNGSLLYGAFLSDGIYQFDLNAGTAIDIFNSRVLLTTTSVYLGSVQLGPDNKIYCSGGSSLHVINSPNSIGTACNLVLNAIYLQGKNSKIGLPNFLSRIQPPYFDYENTCLGDITAFKFNDTTSIVTASWDFGDPASGPLNTSAFKDAKHQFSDTGYFNVEVRIEYTIPGFAGLARDTLKDTLHILPVPFVNLGPDTSICRGDSIEYDVTLSNVSYVWQDGSKKATYTVKNQGNYSARLSNACGSAFDYVNVSYIDSLQPPYDFMDTSICQGSTFRQDATYPGVSYRWQDNSTLSYIDISSNGTYWVEWKNDCEAKSDTFEVTYYGELPKVDLGKDTMICFGSELILNARTNGATDYFWNDGSSNTTFTAKQAGSYWVNVSNQCETLSDTIVISLIFPPEVYLGEDTTLCRYNSIQLDAQNEGAEYLWQDGSTGRYMTVSKEGNYWVDVANNCALDNDSLLALLSYPPVINLGNDTTKCNNQLIKLDAFNASSTYLWQDGSDSPYYNVYQAGDYSVTVHNACGERSKSVTIYDENCECTLFVPNAFTPDGDQVNDYFEVYHECELTDYDMTILNRWGEIIYKSTNPAANWNGFLDGEPLPSDSYVWVIKYVANEGNFVERKTLSGTVLLIR